MARCMSTCPTCWKALRRAFSAPDRPHPAGQAIPQAAKRRAYQPVSPVCLQRNRGAADGAGSVNPADGKRMLGPQGQHLPSGRGLPKASSRDSSMGLLGRPAVDLERADGRSAALGHYDAAHNTIVIVSRVFDHARIRPGDMRSNICSTHEMLHLEASGEGAGSGGAACIPGSSRLRNASSPSWRRPRNISRRYKSGESVRLATSHGLLRAKEEAADYNCGVGDIEVRIVVVDDVDFEEVNHEAEAHAIVCIAVWLLLESAPEPPWWE